MPNKQTSKIKIALWTATIILIFALAKYFNVQELLKNSLNWIRDLGPSGIAAFILIYIAACVLFLPGSVLTLGAGAIFGVMKGSVIVSVASTLGATAAFLIGRYMARSLVASKIAGNRKFTVMDNAVAKEGWKIVGLTRLSPIFPFNLLNYAYGVTKVSLRDYFFASWIGMLPGTVVYVYVGSIAGDVVTLGNSPAKILQWSVRIVGLAATIAVTFYVTKIAKKALDQKVS